MNDFKLKICPVCSSKKINSYKGKSVCQVCGYTHKEKIDEK